MSFKNEIINESNKGKKKKKKIYFFLFIYYDLNQR